MNAEHDQTTDDPDASSDDDVEAQHDTTTPAVSRREFLQVMGAAGAAAAAPTAASQVARAADSDGGKHDAPDLIGQTTNTAYGLATSAEARKAGVMMATSPIAGYYYANKQTLQAAADFGHWVWGEYVNDDDKQNEQLLLDVNAHCHTIADNLERIIQSTTNSLKMTDNEAMIAGEKAAIQAINEGQSEQQAAATAQSEIYDIVAIPEENVYRVWETGIVRAVNLHTQMVHAFDESDDPEPSIVYQESPNDPDHEIIGTRTFELELVNGETIETEALVCDDASVEDEAAVLYVHPMFDSDVNDKVVNLDELQSDANRLLGEIAAEWHANSDVEHEGLYCRQYDSNNPRVDIFRSTDEVNKYLPGDYGGGWAVYIKAHVIDRASTLTSDMQQYVSDLFSALESGEIEDVKDAMSPYAYAEMMAGDWWETGSTGFPVGAARMGGYSTDIKRTGEYTHVPSDGSETTTYSEANLLWDSRHPPALGSISSEEVTDGDWTVTLGVGSGSTLHVDTYSGVTFSASHASESVDSIGVKLGSGDGTTPIAVADSASSITIGGDQLESALSEHDVSHGDTVEITVEATTGAGSSVTATATGVEVLIETRLHVGEAYTAPSKSSVMIADEQGLHDIPADDEVRVESVTDADGNALDYITITDDTLVTMDDTDEIQARWETIIDSQDDVDDETPDDGGDDGPAGPGDFDPPEMPSWLLGGGLVTIIVYYLTQGGNFDGGRR